MSGHFTRVKASRITFVGVPRACTTREHRERQSERARSCSLRLKRLRTLKQLYPVHQRPSTACARLQTTRHKALSPMASRAVYDSSREFSTFEGGIVLDPSPGGMISSMESTIVPVKVSPDGQEDLLIFATACKQGVHTCAKLRTKVKKVNNICPQKPIEKNNPATREVQSAKRKAQSQCLHRRAKVAMGPSITTVRA
jgi:hypothetical protein